MKLNFSGGINELNDIEIPVTDAISGQNFQLALGNTKFKPRLPFDLADTATNASPIVGILQLVKRDGSYTTLIAAGTDVYDWDGTTFTDVGNITSSSELHATYWSLDDQIVITDRNLVTPVSSWDGTTFSTLTHAIGGVTNFYAKYGIVANGRMILANVKTDSTTNPHLIAFSEFENTENFDTASRSGDSGFSTGDEPFYLLTPDLKPVNALFYFQDTIICSTEDGQLFKLVGDDSTNYRWQDFYNGSACIGANSFTDVGDDFFYMRSGGVIESLRSTDRYGDVGTDDASLRIRDTTNDLTGMRAVYDQSDRKVYFFIASKVIVMHKDMIHGKDSPFSFYTTLHPSAFNTQAAEYVINPATGDRTIMFGDDSGNLFDMNGTVGGGDAGTYDVITRRKLPLQEFSYDQFLEGRVFYRRIAVADLSVTLNWGDERNETGLLISLKAPAAAGTTNNYYNDSTQVSPPGAAIANSKFFNDFTVAGNDASDSEYFGEGVVGAGNPVSQGFSAFGKGTSVFVTLEIRTSENFEIDYIEV